MLYKIQLLFIITILFASVYTFDAQTPISGNLSGTLTTGNSPYEVVGDITVLAGSTLTIQAGVEIRFLGRQNIIVQGTLIANGISTDSIRLKSSNPPERGGRIIFASTSQNSVMNYVTLFRMGDNGSDTYAAIEIASSSVQITNCSIINSRQVGIGVRPNVSPVISGCFIDQHFLYGILLEQNSSAFVSNCTIANANIVQIKAYPSSVSNLSNLTDTKIELVGETLSTNLTIPYPGTNSSYDPVFEITVPTGKVITINPKVELYFSVGQGITVQGTLIANGTSTDRIHFKSSHSSVRSGKIIFTSTSQNSIINYATVFRMGDDTSDSYAAIDIASSSVQITNCSIIDSRLTGLGVRSNASPIISGCFIDQHFLYGIRLESNSGAFISDCVITNANFAQILAFPSSVSNLSNLTDIKIQLNGETLNDDYTVPYPGANSFYDPVFEIVVTAGNTLTISPKVNLYFSLDQGITVEGTLIANGTATDNIFFNSSEPSDWAGTIKFTSTSQASIMNYAHLDWMGDNNSGTDAAIIIENSSVQVTNCSIKNSRYYGVEVTNGVSPVISGCVIDQASIGILLNPNSAAFVSNCSITNTAFYQILAYSSSASNISNLTDIKIQLNSETFVSNAVIPYPGTNSVYTSATIHISNGIELTIEAGVTIEFNERNGIGVNGTLKMQGTSSQPITVSSADESYYGGQFNFSNSTQESILEYVNFNRMGDDSSNEDATILCISSSPMISNSTFTDCKGGIITTGTNPQPSIYGCSFDNSVTAIKIISGTPTIECSNFNNNSSFAILNNSANLIVAEDCYWGDASGPYNAMANPSGQGDPVGNNVDFIPFATQPVSCGVLPIELLGFTGNWTKDGLVELQWNAFIMDGFSHFEVERSMDGKAWATISKVESKGVGYTSWYTYFDTDLSNQKTGERYYRLKLIEQDRNYQYSPIILVKDGSTSNPNISYSFPTPNLLVLKSENTVEETITIRIISVDGKIFVDKPVRLQNGYGELELEALPSTSGIYLLQIMSVSVTPSVDKFFWKL